MINSGWNILNFLEKYSSCRKGLYKDFPEILAQKAAKLTPGIDWIVNSNDKKLQDTLSLWIRENNVILKVRKAQYVMSKYGRSMLFLVPSKDGKNINLNYVKNPFDERTAKYNEIDQSAEIWFRNSQNDGTQLMRVVYKKNVIEVHEYFSTNPELRVGMETTSPNEELKLTNRYEFPNELGFVPFVELENLVNNNMWNSTMGNFRPDWMPVGELIIWYQEVYRISNVEAKANRTRYFGELTPDKLLKIKKNGGYQGEDIIGDAWLQANFSSIYGGSSTDAGIGITQGDPKFSSYIDLLKFLEEQIMTGSGYTPNRTTDTSSQYQNKTNALFVDKLDKETTDIKQALLKEKLYILFDCVLKFYNIEPTDSEGNRIYSFEFVNLAITDSVQVIDDNVKLLDKGIISRSEFRSKVLNVPINIAEEQMKKVNEENKKYRDEFGIEENNKKELKEKNPIKGATLQDELKKGREQ